MAAQLHQAHHANLRTATFSVLIAGFREGCGIFRCVGRAPDHAVNGIERQTVPVRVPGFLMPVLLREPEQHPDGILTQGFTAGNHGAGCGEWSTGPVNNVHQVDDMGQGFVVEYRHANNQPDHELKGKLALTQRHRVSEGKGLLNKVGRKEVGKTLDLFGGGEIDNAEGLGKFHLKRAP